MSKPRLDTIFVQTDSGGLNHDLSIDLDTHELYWNGDKLVTEKRWSAYERTLATLGLVAGGLASLSAVVMTVIEVGRTCWGWGG